MIMKNKNLFGLKILIITMLKLLNFVWIKITNASNKSENVKGKKKLRKNKFIFFYILLNFLLQRTRNIFFFFVSLLKCFKQKWKCQKEKKIKKE